MIINQRHTFYPRRVRQRCTLWLIMPLCNVHPLSTIYVVSPILRATTEKFLENQKKGSNNLSNPGIEPESPCPAVPFATSRPKKLLEHLIYYL
ncbi:hypothetical protein SFRURICE_014188, partial [Spodoptera frugiperda]